MNDLPLLPEQPSNTDQIRRFGPPALIAVAALLFILQNTRSVTFNILWFEFRWPLWIMLVAFMLLGAVVFWGADRRRRARHAGND